MLESHGHIIAHMSATEVGIFHRKDTHFTSLNSLLGKKVTTLRGTTSELIGFNYLSNELGSLRKSIIFDREDSSGLMLLKLAKGRVDFAVLPIYARDYIADNLKTEFEISHIFGKLPGVAVVTNKCIDENDRNILTKLLTNDRQDTSTKALLENVGVSKFHVASNAYIENAKNLLILKSKYPELIDNSIP